MGEISSHRQRTTYGNIYLLDFRRLEQELHLQSSGNNEVYEKTSELSEMPTTQQLIKKLCVLVTFWP